MNITIPTFIFTLLSSILGILAAALQTQYPQVAFWSAIGVSICGAVLMAIKQFFPSNATLADKGQLQDASKTTFITKAP